jgi:nucleotidyltransferase/DNA polymerase involved in DNA repair
MICAAGRSGLAAQANALLSPSRVMKRPNLACDLPCRWSRRSASVVPISLSSSRVSTFTRRSANKFAKSSPSILPLIEQLSLDEACLDVTEKLQRIALARDVGLRIREKIDAETGLNASACTS